MEQTPQQQPQKEPQEGEPQPKSRWLATLGRTLRDNAALIAALIALGGVIYTQVVTTNNTQAGLAAQRELEEERAREAELQTYFDDMGQMLLNEDNPLSEADSSDPISTLARAKTLAILERTDKLRKRHILLFLNESRLVRKDEPIVSLVGANLSDADLSAADLRDTNLSRAYLLDADLSDAYLLDADLSYARLSDADLSGAFLLAADLLAADLSGADLSDADLLAADLSDANLGDANLGDANLRGARLRNARLNDARLRNARLNDARGVTTVQLEEQAESLEGATMPDGSRHD